MLRQCGGLPLALRMAGARLRHRPGWTVAVLAERLRDNAGRFDSVFGMSLQQLDAVQRRMFRLLGVLPGADFDAAVAGALADMPPDRVGAVLEELVDAHLVQELSPGRYRMHDLIRRYAADLAADEEPQAEAALRRVLQPLPGAGGRPRSDAALAAPRANPRRAIRRRPWPGSTSSTSTWSPVSTPPCGSARTRWWPDCRRPCGSGSSGTAEPTTRHACSKPLRPPRHVSAATSSGLRCSRTSAIARAASGRLTEALSAYELAEQSGPDDDDLAAGLALRIGFVRRDLGDLEAAQAHFRRARELFEKIGRRVGQSQALAFDGWVTLHLGRRSEAVELARASVALADGPAQITGLVTLGVALASDDPAESLRTLHDALRLAEQNDLQHHQAWCHNYLGVALRVIGSPEKALEHHRRAFELLEPLAEVQLEIDCLHTYAETCRAAGRYDEALALLDRTIELARELGRPYDEKLARAARETVRAEC